MSKRASIEAMEELQAKLAEELVDQLNNGVTIADKKGNIQKISVPSATLNVIRQFCKDNDIVSVPEEDENLNTLSQIIPFNRVVND